MITKNRGVHTWWERHTRRVLDPADHVTLNLRVTAAWRRPNAGQINIWVMFLNLFGCYSLSVTALTLTPCGFFGQSVSVAAADAKRNLFLTLKKPQRICSAPVTADAQAVDARNLARLIAADK